MTSSNYRYAISLPFAAETVIDGAGFVVRLPENILPGGGAPQSHPCSSFITAVRVAGSYRRKYRCGAASPRSVVSLLLRTVWVARHAEEGLVRLYRTEPRSCLSKASVSALEFRTKTPPRGSASVPKPMSRSEL